jgi:predicted small lipoprotein YifL
MRPLIALAAGAALAVALPGCGQKGPLVRPTRSPTTPVVIRTPGTPTPADAPEQRQPDADAPKR